MGRRSEMIGGLMPLADGEAFTSRHRMSKEKYKD